MNSYDVIVVGGGAAGLACAVRLSARRDLKILIIECGQRAGKKLAATGNGQGNVSNLHMSAENFRGGNMELIKSIALSDWKEGLDVFCDFLFVADDKGRVYPAGRQASALSDSLLFTLKKNGAELLLSTRADGIFKSDNPDFPLIVSCGDKKFNCRYAVMATGGKAQKQFFTDGSSYAIAQRLGHKITPLHPSLVQLKTDTYFIKTLKGIRADCNVSAKSQSGVQKACRGDVIFTDYGLSGNAIFGVSPVFSAENGMVSIDFLPDFSEQDISRTLENRLKNGVERREIFSGLVHNQIGRAVVKRADEEGGDPVKTLKNFTLKVGGTLGFDYAQTTCGGVDMRDIGDDLQSKIVKNLYFAGEILDVDGDCGGYNLHWAFTSAKRVAESILKAYAKA